MSNTEDQFRILNNKRKAEALLFASPKPILESHLRSVVKNDLEQVVELLRADYNSSVSAVELVELDAGQGVSFTFSVRADLLEKTNDIYTHREEERYKKSRLSEKDYKVLAIVCFHQPVSHRSLEKALGTRVRKELIDKLLFAKLIRNVHEGSKKKMAPKYVTTPEFLDHLGIEDLDDLPYDFDLT